MDVKYLLQEDVKLTNTQGKTAKVYAGLINKETDVIFASEPSNDILRRAQEAGVAGGYTGLKR